jgi:hypothetical protein
VGVKVLFGLLATVTVNHALFTAPLQVFEPVVVGVFYTCASIFPPQLTRLAARLLHLLTLGGVLHAKGPAQKTATAEG